MLGGKRLGGNRTLKEIVVNTHETVETSPRGRVKNQTSLVWPALDFCEEM